ncbi:MAG: GTP 3',8-cyclase MoaA [Planctomycetota bacterium]|jgi:cyclic pyranopterin phosphate synthase
MADLLELKDSFGRNISYLRVSLTRRCNLRCDYCYGSNRNLFKDEILLTNEQLLDLFRAFALLGLQKIRFTGGEPLLRKGIAELIRKTSAINEISQIAITTNGMLLKKLLPEMILAGINRINISLDTLKRGRFKTITGYDGFDKAVDGINCALKSDVFPIVKINTVVMNGVNDDEIPDFIEWAKPRNVDIRFIEYMPTCGSRKDDGRFLPLDRIKSRIEYDIEEVPSFDSNRGPAKSYIIPGSSARVSFISAVSSCFCQDCNRLRLTSQGDLVGCLFGNNSVNLRNMILRNLSDVDMAEYIRSVVAMPNFRRSSKTESVSDSKPFMRGLGG